MRTLTFRVDGGHFVQRVFCERAGIDGLGMHEHAGDAQHETVAIAGKIRIHDGAGWEEKLAAGDRIDLASHPKHEIQALTDGAIFENLYPLQTLTSSYVETMAGKEVTSDSDLQTT